MHCRTCKVWCRELSGVIFDKKVPTKLKILIYQTVIRPTLLYGCETWPMSVKDERRMATTEMRMVRWAMGVSVLEHRRNEEILEEAKVEQIATVMRRRRLERFGHVKRRGETGNIRAVVEMKMELRWKDTVRRDVKAWSIREEWATDRERWKSLTGRRQRKLRIVEARPHLLLQCISQIKLRCYIFRFVFFYTIVWRQLGSKFVLLVCHWLSHPLS